ncbi:Hypothetical protein D9617_8g051780 [Elsinoe fawcettii]|nr:Hypothetical protein D9617_8g051780 [Elsinoe fawcettii]
MHLLHIIPVIAVACSAAVVPGKRADICGVKGYDRGKGNYKYDDSGKNANYAACSALCAKETKCKGFGFGKKECMLFNIALTNNFDQDDGSADIYYDRGCITSSAPATTSATKPAATTPAATTPAATTPAATTPAATTPAATTRATTTSASATTSSAGNTPVCSGVASTLSITTFRFFNSTHNLDCANPNYPSDAQVCWSSTGVCNGPEPGCTCTPYCYTGLPSYAYQPLGYGPPDTITIGFEGGNGACQAANPQSIRRYEIGSGHFDCGSAADTIGFTGNSDKDVGGQGSVYYNAYGASGSCGGRVPRYEGTFPLSCSRDAGGNATCTAALPVKLNLVNLL